MNLRKTIKRILNEESGDTKTRGQKQARIIKKLLNGRSYEGVCGYEFNFVFTGKDDDRVRSIMIIFSEEWYRTDNDSKYLNKKLQLIQETKKKVKDIIKMYLGIDDIYVGSHLEKCDSESKEDYPPL